jgi:S-adenosylmethionine:tRNA ribosyltransferase-isomerase
MLPCAEPSQKFSEKFPEGRPATEPPEARGLRRDQVRLLVLDRASGHIQHSRFDRLGQFLRPGDLLVLNDSRTMPVALTATLPNGQKRSVKLALSQDTWQCTMGNATSLSQGDILSFQGGSLFAKILKQTSTSRWNIEFLALRNGTLHQIYQSGEPVSYDHLQGHWGLDYFQTVYAAHPGSAEMPSAGRPFSWELLFRLRSLGISIATITLHTTLGPQDDEVFTEPASEEYFVNPPTAMRTNQARAQGRRVIAVGTTVIRALETVADKTGKVQPGHGWTHLHIQPDYRYKVIDGLISGFHERDSSHLDLITSLVSREKLWNAYREAAENAYLWHEFGDASLIM